MMQQQVTQELSPQDFAYIQTVTNTTISTSPGIDFSKFKRGYWVIEVNTVVAGTGVIAVQAQSAANSNFNVFHNMTGVTVTNMSTNNTITTVEIRGDQVVFQNSQDRYVRLNITDTTNAATVCVIGFGSECMQGPSSQYNNTSIVSTVICST